MVSLNVLIDTEIDDLQGLLMAIALRERGHEVVRSFGNDFPLRSSMEFHFGNEGSQAHLHYPGGEVDLERVDVVWSRDRPQTGALADACPHTAGVEYRIAHDTCSLLTGRAFWANPLRASRMAALRSMQLRMAPAAGLRIPDTLVSNRPSSIRDFVARHARVICKPLDGRLTPDRLSAAPWGNRVSLVRSEDLPHDELLRASMGVYQAQVVRQYEVKAQFFGDTCFAVRMDTHGFGIGGRDHHSRDRRGSSVAAAVELPAQVHQACRNLMDGLGLVCCAFDFVVTPDGEWVFIELNDSSQFMFLEMSCPELNVLDACCAFIESRDPDFVYRRPSLPSRLAQVYDPARREVIQREPRQIDAGVEAIPVHAPVGHHQ